MLERRISGGLLAFGLYVVAEALSYTDTPLQGFMRNYGRDILYPLIITSVGSVVAPESEHRTTRVLAGLLLACGAETKQGLFPDLLLFGETPKTFDWWDYGAYGVGTVLANKLDKLISKTFPPVLIKE